MLSTGAVKSAGGAARYFARDDYYTGETSSEMSAWGGAGAKALGLSGEVAAGAFEGILNGMLPDGTLVNQVANRRMGTDLTFSMPKSASIMAYVAGDTRVLDAHLCAVLATMTFVERTMAEGRVYDRKRSGEPVRTRNLIYAVFQHDTSRSLDPQGHLHVVVAAITRTASGAWKALHNDLLHKNNTLIGSAYHAEFRERLEQIGYETRITGKHGQFEILGVPKQVIDAFSRRREAILEKAAELGVSSPRGQDKVVINTRDAKLHVEDKAALREEWRSRAAVLGFAGKDLVERAAARGALQDPMPLTPAGGVHGFLASLRETLGQYLRGFDPMTTNGLARLAMTPGELRTELAVASAVRHLGEREAAFKVTDIYKTALNFGLKGVTIDSVEQRIDTLVEQGQLAPGASSRADGVYTFVTTPGHIAQEQKLLDGIDQGRGASVSIVPASEVRERLNVQTPERTLSGEQVAAVTIALSTTDRIAVIQGVAGAGKTTLIRSIRDLAADQGRQTIGLAFANTMADALRREAGIEAQTVSSFVNAHIRGAIAQRGEAFEHSRAGLAGKVFVLDEASLVSNEAMSNLVTIANAMGMDRLIMVGDLKQLQSIDAGKAFELVQSHNPAIAVLDSSQRQKTEHMQQVAVLGRAGLFKEAFDVLGTRVSSEGTGYLGRAAEKWLALGREERARTAIYASGRKARGELNALVQAGLRNEGTIRGGGLELITLQQVNATREELRHPQTYNPGHVIDVTGAGRAAGLPRGRYDVVGIDAKGRVAVRDARGRALSFDPRTIPANDKSASPTLFEKMPLTLFEGDKVLWRANDKHRGIYNSQQGKVLSITDSHVRIGNPDGRVLEISRSDTMLERLGLAYAINMHQAQGMTTDRGIGAVHSSESNLATRRLTYVMVTRVRHDMEIVTNDKEQLLRTIGRNPGDKLSALETIGEKHKGGVTSVDDRSARAVINAANAGFDPSMSQTIAPGPTDKAVLTAAGFQERLATGKTDIPERNIERGR